MSLRIIVGAMAGGLVLVSLVGVILNGLDETPEPLWMGVWAVAALAAVGAALTEAPGILGLALSFVTMSGYLALLGLLAVPVMLWLSWPSRSNVARRSRRSTRRGPGRGCPRPSSARGPGRPAARCCRSESCARLDGRGSRIRTGGLPLPKRTRYQAAPYPVVRASTRFVRREDAH